MRLKHESQRSGTIEFRGPPLPPGTVFKAGVNEDGEFEAPADVAERLFIALYPTITKLDPEPDPEPEPDEHVIHEPAPKKRKGAVTSGHGETVLRD